MKNKNRDKFIVNQREIELLNKYYEIDNENKIVTMPLHYEKASSLINEKIVSKDNYFFDYDELASINEMINRVPIAYKIKIDIQIDDYEGYDAKKLLDGFNDAMELNQFNLIRERKTKWLKAGILLLVGITILFFVAAIKINNWFSSLEHADVYTEIFDIVSWVFIWETVTMAFLTPSELAVNSNVFRLRVLNVAFLSGDNVLANENLSKTSEKWETEKRLEKFSRLALLMSGVAFIALGVLNIIIGLRDVITISQIEGFDSAEGLAVLIISLILVFMVAIIEILGGIATLFRYIGRNKFVTYSKIFSVLIILATLFIIALSVGNIESIISSSATIIVIILYFFGLISSIVINKNKKM